MTNNMSYNDCLMINYGYMQYVILETWLSKVSSSFSIYTYIKTSSYNFSYRKEVKNLTFFLKLYSIIFLFIFHLLYKIED